jgi:hypothetical protein
MSRVGEGHRRKLSAIGGNPSSPPRPGAIRLGGKAASREIVADASYIVACSIRTDHSTHLGKAELSVASEMENIQK